MERSLPARPGKFHLSKWYADCVSDSGDVLIAYYGLAQWRGITLHYSSLLTLFGSGPPRARYSISKSGAPSFDGSTLCWKSHSLRFEGDWKSIYPPHLETIFSSNQGTVEWNCLQPRAGVEIHCANNKVLCGLGYAERVEMTIPPWEIPIHELYWGRFLSPSASLIWMDWRGPFAKRILLHNGSSVVGGAVTENQVLFGTNGELTLGKGAILRQGKLGYVALAAMPGVRTFLPRRILGVQETKWRSHAQMKVSAEVSDGWSIHEVVKWPL